MAKMNLERLAAERRMRRRGAESVHESGLGIVRRAEDRLHMDRLAERIAAWAKEEAIEAVAERNITHEEKRRADRGSGVPLSELISACED